MDQSSGALAKRIKLKSSTIHVMKRDNNCSYNDGIKRLHLKNRNRRKNATYYAIQIPFKTSIVETDINPLTVQIFYRFVKEGKATLVFKPFHFQLLIFDAEPKELQKFIKIIKKCVCTETQNSSRNKTNYHPHHRNPLQQIPINTQMNRNNNYSNAFRNHGNRRKIAANRRSVTNLEKRLLALKRSVCCSSNVHDDNQSVFSDTSAASINTRRSNTANGSLRIIRERNFLLNKQKREILQIEEKLLKSRYYDENDSRSKQHLKDKINENKRKIEKSNKIFCTPIKERNERKQKLIQRKFLKNISKYIPPETFSDGQKEVMSAVINGENVFITGGAGTGKSFLIHEIIRVFPVHTTYATACTGVASSQVNGMTIYSFCGIGCGNAPQNVLLHKILKRKDTVNRIRRAQLLIIDEISMLSGDILDKINFVISNIRNKQRKEKSAIFGGLQIIFCGDFFQLPPVWNKKQYGNQLQQKLFAFESKIWKTMQLNIIQLQHIFRQQNDNKFQQILNEIRIGSITDSSLKLLRSRIGAKFDLEKTNGIRPTILLTHKNKVQLLNEKELNLLSSKEINNYSCKDRINGEILLKTNVNYQFFCEQLKNICTAEIKLRLKTGAQVILLKNINVSEGLFNGSRGVVIGFSDIKLPIVQFMNGREITVGPEQWMARIEKNQRTFNIQRRQIPLALGWALSIHKSQGMSLDLVRMSLKSVFECGQFYVALSRATTLSGVSIIDEFDKSKIKAHPKVNIFYASINNKE